MPPFIRNLAVAVFGAPFIFPASGLLSKNWFTKAASSAVPCVKSSISPAALTVPGRFARSTFDKSMV
ncbi:hypothetical protein AB832_01260 [Flavobacteriaceae bacterium (ex Bugula neritina AB1)]|nr:hypothetical protein AB832_01260 [Flavobacteriaceae bacterium (ex Bugula neritina AB1)]